MSEQGHDRRAAATLGMWLFLFTEIFLFGGLFVLYAAYLRRYPTEFHQASGLLDLRFGAANTVVLLTSSLTVVLALVAHQRQDNRKTMAWLGATAGLAVLFLVNKFFEWQAKFDHSIYPNSPELLARSEGQNIFFSLYFLMTGLHGLHVLLGLLLFGFVALGVKKEKPVDRTLFFNAGLYWHLVDVVWIYLFPLFYLIT